MLSITNLLWEDSQRLGRNMKVFNYYENVGQPGLEPGTNGL